MRPKPTAAGALAELGNISPRRKAALNALNDGVPLLILGMTLLFSIRLFSIGENEALALSSGASPLHAIFAQFRHGLGLRETSALYALWLHVWLFLSAGALAFLRVPPALFFLGGVWLLSRAARLWGGDVCANSLLWLAAFWPYAFHYGSQATEFTFLFFLIAALILAYLQFCESPQFASWAVVALLGLLLIYASYFGWAIIVLLGLDCWLRNQNKARPAGVRLLGTLGVLTIAYIPLWPECLREFWTAVKMHPSWRVLLLNAGYNLYVLVASESVAPWFWRFGVPVTLAIATALLLSWFCLGWEGRRFLLFGGLLIIAMDFLGALQTDRLLFVAPLFLLPIAIALCTTENRYLRRALAAALVVAVGIGWCGTYARRYYATARFAEPWSSLAAETAGAVQQGASVVSNSPAIFLYLTYYLREPESDSHRRFSGFLPDSVRNSHVWSADGWEAAGRPIQAYMIWMDATSSSSNSQSMGEAAESLDSKCDGRVARYLVRDPAYDWKKRFFPELGATPWRVEIRQYLCGEGAAPPATPPAPNPNH